METTLFLTTMAVLALLGSSAAQTTHTVGGSLGWTLAAGVQSAYTSWAGNQTFAVGDTLVFTFASGRHDVAEVTRADFDACNTNNPIFTIMNSPATVILNSTGSHYYICTFSGHCNAGQKLQLNVSAAASPQPASPAPRASSPVPQPASPAPGASSPATPPAATPPTTSSPSPTEPNLAPAPGPSRDATTYTVLDNQGWTIPRGGAAAYQTWASNNTFMVGDVLVFNYPSGVHDVAEVTRQSYQSCSGSDPISMATSPPTRITLATAGEHYFICTISGHCNAGQQLAINVSSNGTPPSPSVPSAQSPDSSATSVGFAAVSATLFSLAVALFFVF